MYKNKRLPSVMKHNFSQVPNVQIPRSSFNRSCGYKTAFDGGYLVPIFWDEALPGDTHNVRMSAFSRMATPLHPIMDNLYMDTFFFAVPIRLIWDNWQKFNGEQENPGDSTDYLVPQLPAPEGGWTLDSITDYLGQPLGVEYDMCAFWHRAYNLIWNEWFRDQNLQDSLPVPKGDGPDDPADYELQRRGKRHDYFTSGLPWPQKGDSVDIPLGERANIRIDQITSTGSTQDGKFFVGQRSGSSYVLASSDTIDTAGFNWGDGTQANLYADLTDATAATINQLRQAFQIQKIYEKDARGGTRYTEILQSHFGVTSPDSRLQRPEYLGGGSTPIVINPVANTAGLTGNVGDLAAIGTATLSGHGFTKSFTEHCVILGFVNVRADLTYQQGLHRAFSRQTRWDFYWPSLAHIGEQAVLNKEIYIQGTSADDDVFNYQERFAEYRYKPSTVSNRLRSSAAQSLDTWHLAQDFASLPLFNDEFIVDEPPIERVVAVLTEPQFLFDSYFQIRTARPMPVFGVPGMIDHF